MDKTVLLYSCFILFGTFISSISQVILKREAIKEHESALREYMNLPVISAYILFVGATLCTVIAYKKVPLSMGPILETTGYIYITIFGVKMFHEKISVKKIIALALIISGIIIAGCADEESVPDNLSDAVLYQIEDGNLEYNVIHSAGISDSTKVSGNGINSLEALNEILGTPDRAPEVFGTDISGRNIRDVIRADICLNDKGDVESVYVKDISERPVIGLSWQDQSLDVEYVDFAEAFERGGAIAVFLPQLESAEDAEKVLREVDGVFVSGGEDWNPANYGEIQTPHGAEWWNDNRDLSDRYLILGAIESDTPLLCSCRGEQGLNVVLGGGLIQDVRCYLGEKVLSGEIPVSRVTEVKSGTLPQTREKVQDMGYSYFDENYSYIGDTFDEETGTYMDGSGCEEGHLRVCIDGIGHTSGAHALEAGSDGIGISKSSKWLYDIIGSESIDVVHSSHHQAVDPVRLGNGITIAAMSSDGIVEAIEYQDNTFALGLQWHPENDALHKTAEADVDQDLSNKILGELIKYAALRRKGINR